MLFFWRIGSEDSVGAIVTKKKIHSKGSHTNHRNGNGIMNMSMSEPRGKTNKTSKIGRKRNG